MLTNELQLIIAQLCKTEEKNGQKKTIKKKVKEKNLLATFTK